jgi:hypothetical protein
VWDDTAADSMRSAVHFRHFRRKNFVKNRFSDEECNLDIDNGREKCYNEHIS